MNAPLRIIGLLLALAVTFLALPLNAQSVYGQVWGHLISASGGAGSRRSCEPNLSRHRCPRSGQERRKR
jgi:hypothetical protein